MYDIIIIGAGVTGCAVARYLSRYEGKMLVLEKAEDVCCGTSKANSAIVHAGFDAAHGSLMAKMNLEGNLMMPQLAKDLDFAFKMNGSLVVCMSEEDLPKLHALYENGVKKRRQRTGDRRRKAPARTGTKRIEKRHRRTLGTNRRHCLPVQSNHSTGRKRL